MPSIRVAAPILLLSCMTAFVGGCAGSAASPTPSTSPPASDDGLPSPSPSTSLSPSPAPSAIDVVRLALDGDAPLGIDLDGDHAWVVLTDSAGLTEVNLSTQQLIRTIGIGTGGQQVIAAPNGIVYIGRYATGGIGEDILEVDTANAAITGIPLGPIGGLGLEDDQLWALERTGEVARIDAGSRSSTGSVTVHVDQDAHMDLVAGTGSAWVSGDRTPVHRINGEDVAVAADRRGLDRHTPVSLPAGVRLAADHAWVTDYETDELVGIPRP